MVGSIDALHCIVMRSPPTRFFSLRIDDRFVTLLAQGRGVDFRSITVGSSTDGCDRRSDLIDEAWRASCGLARPSALGAALFVAASLRHRTVLKFMGLVSAFGVLAIVGVIDLFLVESLGMRSIVADEV